MRGQPVFIREGQSAEDAAKERFGDKPKEGATPKKDESKWDKYPVGAQPVDSNTPKHLQRGFTSATKPLRENVSYGDTVQFMSGRDVHTGKIYSFGGDEIAVRTIRGLEFIVPRSQLRHPKDFRGAKEE